MSEPVIIAVDGPAASGKGTLARRLAAHFDYAYLDTGSLYRALAYDVLRRGEAPENASAGLRAAKALDLAMLNDPDILAALRTDAVGIAASLVAAQPDTRAAILQIQRDIADTPPDDKAGAVLDGRDIGTIVCPHAAHKIFVTARAEIRAERRWQELYQHDPQVSLEDVLADLKARDKRDSERVTAPMRAAQDAHLLDTSDLSIEEAFAAALALVSH
ncbi:MAG: (d)CMP kinase [Pseudomonadota bacterium]|nr:(d)CMP kinase [Pseudomonadota bacterium]